MIRRPPRSTLFPYRRSSDLRHALAIEIALEAVADRLVEENARPAGAQHDRHRPGRRFHRRELEARLACRLAREALPAAVLEGPVESHAATTPVRPDLPLVPVFGHDRDVEPRERPDVTDRPAARGH